MRQRGRKSLDALLIPAGPNGIVPARPDAPYGLTDNEADIWRQIVNSMAPEHFAASHYPMLSQLCRHCNAANFIGAMLASVYRSKKIDREEYASLLAMQSQESNAINRLMRALRLTPQSISRAESVKNRPITMLEHQNPWDRKVKTS
jgi:hypothetical protein